MANLQLEIKVRELDDLQQHIANLLEYYESDIRLWGRLRERSQGSTRAYAQELMCDRLEQIENTNHLWYVLTQK